VIKESSILRIHLSGNELGLKKDSDILVDQIRAIDNRRFLKEIGSLSPLHQDRLLENIKIVLME
jgi:mRNA interferase MazF